MKLGGKKGKIEGQSGNKGVELLNSVRIGIGEVKKKKKRPK